MAVQIDTLHNLLRIELPGIPEPVLASGVKKSIQEFFKKSEAWRHTVPGLLDWTTAVVFPALVESTELPADTRLMRVTDVKYASDGISLKEIKFRTRAQLDEEYWDWEIKDGNSPLRWTNDTQGDEPRIIPIAIADVTGSLKVRVVVAPLDALTDLPDFLYYEFEDDFKNGALARLMKIPGKDWTNFTAAAAYASLFLAGYTKAKSRVNAAYGQPSRETGYGGL